MAKKKRSTEKEEFWRIMLIELELSGLSVREFCRSEEISQASLYSWRREIARRDAEEEPTKPSRSSLVPVTVVEDIDLNCQQMPQASSGSGQIEVVTANGLTIRLGDAVPTERLRTVLNMVVQLDQGAVGC